MALTDQSKADIRDNVARILEDNHFRSDTDLAQSALGYLLENVPSNFVPARTAALLPEERHVLSVVTAGVTASIPEDVKLSGLRQRLAALDDQLAVAG